MQPIIMMTPISGNGVRPSLFGSTVEQTRGFHPTMAGGYWLGQTGMDWYDRGRNAVAKFDQLLARLQNVPNKTERDSVMAWVGPVGSSDTPRERYLTVVTDVNYILETDPPQYDKYDIPRLQHRVTKLESFNTELETKIRNAELAYGTTGGGGVSPGGGAGVKPGQPGAAGATGTATSPWTLPIIVGVGAIGVAVLVTMLSKK